MEALSAELKVPLQGEVRKVKRRERVENTFRKQPSTVQTQTLQAHANLPVGPLVGAPLGLEVGEIVGPEVGELVGPLVGPVVGPVVGPREGALVGSRVLGDSVGLDVGGLVGCALGSKVVGLEVGSSTSHWKKLRKLMAPDAGRQTSTRVISKLLSKSLSVWLTIHRPLF